MADDFVFTDEMAVVSNRLWMITSAVGACMCFLVLVEIAIVAAHPVSRPHLDRVSFRILVYALVANTAFGIVNAIGGSFTGPTWTCGFTIWILQLTLELSSFLIMCIAINLELVIVHQVNGRKMEKYYIAGSLFISLGVTVPAYATKQYGWDPLVKDCWYANTDPKQRLAWQIGTQLAWTLISVLGEVIASAIVIAYMVKHQIRHHKILSHGTFTSKSSSLDQHIANANKYRNILIRVGLYPMASCIINITSVMCVIYATAHNGVHTMTGYRILLVSDFMYGGRAVVYAMIAATDPSLLNAWRALLRRNRRPSFSASGSIGHFASATRNNVDTVQIELQTVDDHDQQLKHQKSAVFTGAEGFPSTDYVPMNKNGMGLEGERRDYRYNAPASSMDLGRMMVERKEQEELQREIDQEEFKKRI